MSKDWKSPSSIGIHPDFRNRNVTDSPILTFGQRCKYSQAISQKVIKAFPKILILRYILCLSQRRITEIQSVSKTDWQSSFCMTFTLFPLYISHSMQIRSIAQIKTQKQKWKEHVFFYQSIGEEILDDISHFSVMISGKPSLIHGVLISNAG